MLVMNRATINANNNDNHYEALVERPEKADRNYDTPRNYYSLLIGYNLVSQQEDGRSQTHGDIIHKDGHNHNDQS